MARGKKVGKCYCGGNIMKYEKDGFLGAGVKCNKCGAGDMFNDEKKLKKVIKALATEDGW